MPSLIRHHSLGRVSRARLTGQGLDTIREYKCSNPVLFYVGQVERRRADNGKMVTPFGDPYSEMASSPDDCHYYELGNYITVCKPGRDLRRKQTSARLIYRHGPPVVMISRCDVYLPACHGQKTAWTGVRCQAKVGKSILRWRSRRHLESRS